jgi:hypothetical protein
MLWLSENRGQYIPQDFAASFADRDRDVSGVAAEDWAILDAGPDHEWYWDAWDDVSTNAVITDDSGNRYYIHQDGDCWLVPFGMTWDDEEDAFTWPDDDDEDGDEGEDDEPEDHAGIDADPGL